MKLLGWPEIGPVGGVLLTPYVPSGITGIDDEYDVMDPKKICTFYSWFFRR
jgi:hypothetical protein